MRLVKPNDLAGSRGNKPPARPDWYAEWLRNQGKWVLLECGCIEDVHIPQCITMLTGKRIYVLCPFDMNHGMQLIKRIEIQDRGYQGSIHNTDRYVEINPVTGAQVPIEDLKYAATHMSQLMRSGAIREDRWAFLWYH